MVRLLHTADVHLGARYRDLGPSAADQRERQMTAFKASVELALSEKVDLFIVAGDLFDSNTQPRRSVEAVAGQLRRLADSGIAVALLPGTHDVYDAASIYRAYDLPALAGHGRDDAVVVLTPDRPAQRYARLELTVHGMCFATKRAPHSPLQGFRVAPGDASRWHVGVIHGALAIPGRTDHDEVVFTAEEIAASGLDYLALGHWHSFQQGRSRKVPWAYSGAPEPVALDQDQAGSVLLVTLEAEGADKRVAIEQRRVGRTRFVPLEMDLGEVTSQAALEEAIAAKADPDAVIDVRLRGVWREDLDLDTDELERALAARFLRVRVRNLALPELPSGPLPPEDTIAGAFIRDLGARIQAAHSAGRVEEEAELRDGLRLGRLFLAGHDVPLAGS
ncbi:MAG TPA: DNA repair exonuclease [Candidatus Limnocylindrales bacterium]|nr:DNA repair exonuclease [Candidatus Limnocylindrales bacterium]